MCRVSYLFGLQGPSVSIDTACSSSLVAAHYAARDLVANNTDAALAAGVSLTLSARKSAAFTVTGTSGCVGLIYPAPWPTDCNPQQMLTFWCAVPSAGMLAPDGRCKSLDAAADGYVRAEDCIAFLLTSGPAEDSAAGPAEAAVVVCGSSVNQDGRSSSLTAPNGPAQQAAIRAALRAAAMQASSVVALEMHGTGTALGDPIEVGAAVAVLPVS